MKLNTFMKPYLWAAGLLLTVSLAFEITDDEPSDLIDYLDYLFWLIALIGVFGYCYSKKILTNQFWRIYLPLIILWDVCITYRVINSDPEFQELAFLVLLLAIYIIILIPEYTALYLYGNRSKKKKWGQNELPPIKRTN